MGLNRLDQGWLPGNGCMLLASSMRRTSTLMPGSPAGGVGDGARNPASTSAGFSSGIMRRSTLKLDLSRHHVGVGAAADQANIKVRLSDAFTFERMDL